MHAVEGAAHKRLCPAMHRHRCAQLVQAPARLRRAAAPHPVQLPLNVLDSVFLFPPPCAAATTLTTRGRLTSSAWSAWASRETESVAMRTPTRLAPMTARAPTERAPSGCAQPTRFSESTNAAALARRAVHRSCARSADPTFAAQVHLSCMCRIPFSSPLPGAAALPCCIPGWPPVVAAYASFSHDSPHAAPA